MLNQKENTLNFFRVYLNYIITFLKSYFKKKNIIYIIIIKKMEKTQEDLNNLILQEIQNISNIPNVIDTINKLDKNDDYYYMLYNLDIDDDYYYNPTYNEDELDEMRTGGDCVLAAGILYALLLILYALFLRKEKDETKWEFCKKVLFWLIIFPIWGVVIPALIIIGLVKMKQRYKDNDGHFPLTSGKNEKSFRDENYKKDTDFINCYLNPNDNPNTCNKTNLSSYTTNKESFIKKINKTYNLENL